MAATFITLVLAATGCFDDPQGGLFSRNSKVQFSAATRYLNGIAGTKTDYSGDRTATSGYESINWVTGDSIRIQCEQILGPESNPGQKSGLYAVHPKGGNPTEASVSANDDNSLRWNSAGDAHHFFAAYPTGVTLDSTFYSGKKDVIRMGHSVPTQQSISEKATLTVKVNSTTRSVTEYKPDMALVAMGAYAKEASPASTSRSVDLYFRPLVTTLRVELIADDELSTNNKLTMLRLKSSTTNTTTHPLYGTYSVAVGDYDTNRTPDLFGGTTGVIVQDNGNGTKTGFKPFASFGHPYGNAVYIVPAADSRFWGGVQLESAQRTAFTFVMCPADAEQLTLELTFGGDYNVMAGGIVNAVGIRTLELKNSGNWVTFGAMQKHYLDGVQISKMMSGSTNPYNPDVAPFDDPNFEYAVSPTAHTLWTGESFTLTASSSASPAPTYTFAAGNTRVELEGTGPDTRTVKAKPAPNAGKAEVTVSATRYGQTKSDKKSTVTIRELTSLTLDKHNLSLTAGGPDSTLTPDVRYKDTLDDKRWTAGDWTWSVIEETSSAPVTGVVSVTNGVVRPVAPGTVRVICSITKGGVTKADTCLVKVSGPANQFSVSYNGQTPVSSNGAPVTAASPINMTDENAATLPFTVTTTMGYTVEVTDMSDGLPVVSGTLPSGTGALTNDPASVAILANPGKNTKKNFVEKAFSVSATKKVYFSPGNLQYQGSTATWRFAENQFDYVGDAAIGTVYVGNVKSDNASIAQNYTGWIDLFGWGTNGKNYGAVAHQPWSTSTVASQYGPPSQNTLSDDSDWGANTILDGTTPVSPNTYRALANQEWRYLLREGGTGRSSGGATLANIAVNSRTFKVTFKAQAPNDSYAVSFTIEQPAPKMTGLIIFPDDFDYANVFNGNPPNTQIPTNLTYPNWETLESLGCVFLPPTGARQGTVVTMAESGLTHHGIYRQRSSTNVWYTIPTGWSASNQAYLTGAHGSVVKHVGAAVRLVKDAWGVTNISLNYNGEIIKWVGDDGGNGFNVAATVHFSDGSSSTTTKVFWSSSDANVATVNGVQALNTSATATHEVTVKPVGPGTATITASVDGKQKTFTIKVRELTGVTVTLAEETILTGSSTTASYTINWTDENGDPQSNNNAAVTGWSFLTESGRANGWKSSATGVATVNASGRVTASPSVSGTATSEISYAIARTGNNNNTAAAKTSGSKTLTVKAPGTGTEGYGQGTGGVF